MFTKFKHSLQKVQRESLLFFHYTAVLRSQKVLQSVSFLSYWVLSRRGGRVGREMPWCSSKACILDGCLNSLFGHAGPGQQNYQAVPTEREG